MTAARFSRPLAIALTFALGLLAPPAFAAEEGWIPLFNGKDLEGWTPKITGHPLGDNFADTFRVEGGVIKVAYDKYPGAYGNQFGHLFYKTKLAHYKLRVEYRFVGDQAKGGPGWATRNSGVMIHCQDPKTMAVGQEFPVSIEVQYLGGLADGKPRATANACTPGTNVVMKGKLITPHTIDSAAKTYPGDQWVTVEVEVHGAGKITHRVEGQPVLEYEKPQLDPKDADARKLIAAEGRSKDDLLIGSGFIALQAESHPIEFRKVEMMPLPE